MDASKLNLRTVMLHSVQKAGKSAKDEQPPALTDVPVVLTALVRSFLEEKVRTTLTNKGRPVTEDIDIESPSAQIIRDYLGQKPEDRDLVGTSKKLAVLLHEAQPGISPNGMVLVADVELAGGDAFLMAKLDIETGVRASTREVDGQTQATIEIVPDLFVTDQTKVFKVALFPASGVKDAALHGQVVDAQITGSGIADFFLHLLGCGLSQRPQELTEHFFVSTQEFLNSGAVKDPEVRAKIEISLMSELGNEARQVNPASFAMNNLPAVLRDPYLTSLRERGVSTTSFTKNTELVENRLKRVQIETDSGILVLASPDKIADGTVELSGEGAGRVEIHDGIKRVSGRGER